MSTPGVKIKRLNTEILLVVSIIGVSLIAVGMLVLLPVLS